MSADPMAAYSWIIRGMGGVVNMLEKEVESNQPIGQYWKDELKCLQDRITRVVQIAEGNKSNGEAKAEEGVPV